MHNSLLINNCKLRCAWGSEATPNPDQFTDGLRFLWKAVYCNCGQTFSLHQQKHKTSFVWECSFVVFMKMIMKSELSCDQFVISASPISARTASKGHGFANMQIHVQICQKAKFHGIDSPFPDSKWHVHKLICYGYEMKKELCWWFDVQKNSGPDLLTALWHSPPTLFRMWLYYLLNIISI